MWPELQRWWDRQRGIHAGNLPPLETYPDTLKYLAGGMPEVVHAPLHDGLYGTYDPIVPQVFGKMGGVPFHTEGRSRDTITVTNGRQSDPLPYDFVLAHEMGHKLYNAGAEDSHSPAQFSVGANELKKIVGNISMDGDSEDFAKNFALAMEQVRGSGYKAPDWTHQGTAPIYVQALANWARKRLENYDRKY